nr:hypothetical protein [Saccharothrix coeruleofusca]
MEFRLLGDIEAHLDGRPADLGHLQRRWVLAVLLMEPDRVVGVQRLVARVWAHRRLSHNPRAAVRQNVAVLRKALSENVVIRRRNLGCRLVAPPEAVDLHRFDRFVRQARAVDDDRAAALFERALGLWRGQPTRWHTTSGSDSGWPRNWTAASDSRCDACTSKSSPPTRRWRPRP